TASYGPYAPNITTSRRDVNRGRPRYRIKETRAAGLLRSSLVRSHLAHGAVSSSKGALGAAAAGYSGHHQSAGCRARANAIASTARHRLERAVGYCRAGDEPVGTCSAARTSGAFSGSVTALRNACASDSVGHFWRPSALSCASAFSALLGSVSVTDCGVKVTPSTFVNGTALATGCGKLVEGPGRRCARAANVGFVANARANLCAGESEGQRALPIAVSSAHAASLSCATASATAFLSAEPLAISTACCSSRDSM